MTTRKHLPWYRKLLWWVLLWLLGAAIIVAGYVIIHSIVACVDC